MEKDCAAVSRSYIQVALGLVAVWNIFPPAHRRQKLLQHLLHSITCHYEWIQIYSGQWFWQNIFWYLHLMFHIGVHDVILMCTYHILFLNFFKWYIITSLFSFYLRCTVYCEDHIVTALCFVWWCHWTAKLCLSHTKVQHTVNIVGWSFEASWKILHKVTNISDDDQCI